MDRKTIYDNSIILVGPSCVGKSLISEELAMRTGMPLLSVDDIIYFLAEMKNNGLKNTPAAIEKYKKLQRRFAFNYQEIKISRNDTEKVALLEESIDKIIEKFQAYDEFLELDRYKQLYEGYCNMMLDLNNHGISSHFLVVLSQGFTSSILYDIISNLDVPAIIDVSASDGWFSADYKPSKHDADVLRWVAYDTHFEAMNNLHDEIFRKFGQKVFLHPGVDYSHRQNKYYEENNILVNNLDRFFEYADLCVSTNGFFNEPENPVFKKCRYFIDVNGNTKKDELLNKAEIANICDQILTGLDELKQNQMQ